jgi:polysaccharide pyruvyl transferase WcaK-like protein
MRIFVYGWYGHENLGDESYKISFREIWPDHEFIFSDKIDKNENYDLCILGGGDVVRDKSLEYISNLDCPKIAVSVTITSQALVNEIHNLDHIYVRDMNSFNNLISFGYDRVSYLPDISIILQGNKQIGNEIISSLFENNKSQRYSKVYSIVVNSHLLGDQNATNKQNNMFYKMAYDIAEVIDKTNASFLFLPFATSLPWDDRVSNGLVNSFTKFHNKNCVVYDRLGVEESLNIIAASDLVITSRFHGLIFTLGNKVPSTTISFHDKTSGFCDTINKSYINYWNFSAEKFEKSIEQSNKEIIEIDIKKIKKQYREKIYLLS